VSLQTAATVTIYHGMACKVKAASRAEEDPRDEGRFATVHPCPTVCACHDGTKLTTVDMCDTIVA